jgi:hypothetical protein
MCELTHGMGAAWARHAMCESAFNPSGRAMAPGVDSASYRNEYQAYLLEGKGGWCVVLTTLPRLYTDYLGILEALTSWSPQGLPRFVKVQISFTILAYVSSVVSFHKAFQIIRFCSYFPCKVLKRNALIPKLLKTKYEI